MEVERTKRHDIAAEYSPRPKDVDIAELAGRQHGVVARRQLVELGLARGSIWHRLDAGRLHAVHSGIYCVGHRALSRNGRWMAAVLAAGTGAVLSHRSAAALWKIRETTREDVEVTARRRVRKRRGIESHRANLPADEVTVADGLPVTTVSRTLLDLASVLPVERVRGAIRKAETRQLADRISLAALLRRYPGHRGVAVIRALISDAEIGSMVTRSELEDRFVALVNAAGLPRPQTNVSLEVGGAWLEVDCLWRAERLIVELDGHAFHAPAEAYERDRARDRALHVAGWRIVRITWRQLHDDSIALTADLRSLLEAAAADSTA